MQATLSAAITYLATILTAFLHTWTPVERALGVLAVGLALAAVGGRVLAQVLRVAILCAAVLVAAKMAGVKVG